MKDLFTNWRTATDGNLTATETTTGVQIGPSPLHGHRVVVHVPAFDAAGDTLDITFEESSTEGGTYRRFATLQPQITGTLVDAESGDTYKNEIVIHPTQEWVRVVLTVAGATPNFGNVHVGLDTGAYPNLLQAGAMSA